MNQTLLKILLRISISAGFISAVADRFGLWGKQHSVWGNWTNFVNYTKQIIPFVPESLVSAAAILATAAEIIFPVFLILGFKTELFARLSGFLLLIFALSMTFSTGIKGALDFSVYTASFAAFALGSMKRKYLELDLYVK